MKIQKVKMSALKYAGYNPRVDLKPGDDEYEKIKRSIKEFGFVEPIIINSDMTIIGGHQRYKVLKELGVEEVECSIVDLDKTKEKALNIALNKISGIWDYQKLEMLINEIAEENQDLISATGFSDSEIENLKTDFISDLLEEEYSTVNRQLNEFSITFNIPKEYESKFAEYIKANGKTHLVEVLIKEVEGVDENA